MRAGSQKNKRRKKSKNDKKRESERMDRTDPMLIFAENERRRHRRADEEPRGLSTVDEWAELVRSDPGYTNRVVTFAPDDWRTAVVIKQAEYTRLFSSRFPEVHSVLVSVPGVCVAGGAAAWPFLRHDSSTGDVDIFVYANDGLSLMYKAEDVARALRAAFAGASISEALTPGLVTFLIWRDGCFSKIQLILRDFCDMEQLLHGFDIGACCVGFDGNTTFMTELAMVSLMHRVNIVFPMYRSISFEARLIKYFHRGLALAFPHLREGALVAGTPLVMPRMTLTPRFVRGRFAVGAVATTSKAEPVSDYEYDGSLSRWLRVSSCHRVRYGATRKNIAFVASGKSDFVVFGPALMYAAYAASPPTLGDILPLYAVEKHIDGAIRRVVTHKGLLDVACLRKLFCMTDAQISAFAVAVARAVGPVDANHALAPFRSALLEKYRAATERAIEWCIVVDPQRQYTVSRNPTPESDLAWYGEHAFSETQPAASTDESLVAVLGRMHAQNAQWRPCDTDTCALCQCDVTRGSNDTITLKCGHTFHCGKERGGCQGLVAWAIKRSTCPLCRRDFNNDGPVENLGTRRRPEAARLEVEWP